MGKFVVRILGPAADFVGMGARSRSNSKAEFLERFDWEAWDGKGACYTTKDPRKARVFTSGTEAFLFMKKEAPSVPEGWPEKTYQPLTAYAYAIENHPIQDD